MNYELGNFKKKFEGRGLLLWEPNRSWKPFFKKKKKKIENWKYVSYAEFFWFEVWILIESWCISIMNFGENSCFNELCYWCYLNPLLGFRACLCRYQRTTIFIFSEFKNLVGAPSNWLNSYSILTRSCNYWERESTQLNQKKKNSDGQKRGVGRPRDFWMSVRPFFFFAVLCGRFSLSLLKPPFFF